MNRSLGTNQFLLLLDPRRCPACGQRAANLDAASFGCGSCGTRLFRSDCDFAAIDRDDLANYWVFFFSVGKGAFLGWVHGDNLSDPNPRPLPPSVKKAKLPRDYGKRLPKGVPMPANCSTGGAEIMPGHVYDEKAS